MSDIYKLQYNGMTLAHQGWNGYVSYEEPIYPSGTYFRKLYFNSSATSAGAFEDSIHNYDLLRITTMPYDPITNKLVAPNVPTYVEPEYLKDHLVHLQPVGFSNEATISTTGYFIWADTRLSASVDGKNFEVQRPGTYYRIGGTRWNTTGTPTYGDPNTYQNYLRPVYQVDGICYNNNRELLFSSTSQTTVANLDKSITGNDYQYIQIKHSCNIASSADGVYISQIPIHTSNTRDSLSTPYGLYGNWYNGLTILQWSNNYKTLSCLSAKSFQKSLTTTAAMTGNTDMTKNNILAVWGVK